jgi:hypothetical protein
MRCTERLYKICTCAIKKFMRHALDKGITGFAPEVLIDQKRVPRIPQPFDLVPRHIFGGALATDRLRRHLYPVIRIQEDKIDVFGRAKQTVTPRVALPALSGTIAE